MATETKAVGFLLSDDLIFASRIVGTARDLGFVIKQAKTVDQSSNRNTHLVDDPQPDA